MALLDLAGPDFLGAVRFFGDPGLNRRTDRSKSVRSPLLFIAQEETAQCILANGGYQTKFLARQELRVATGLKIGSYIIIITVGLDQCCE